jgi:hypothetical protein
MATFQNLLDQARLTLQDADKTRYPDSDLMTYANEAMRIFRKVRADLFFLTLNTPLSDFATTDTFPFAAEFEYPVKRYVIAASQFRDDEYAVNGKAEAFYKKFESDLKGA